MKNFNKILRSLIAFLACVVLLGLLIVEPYFRTNAYYFVDAEARKEMAGSLNLLVSGASHAMTAIEPEIMDIKLKCNSYNLAQNGMTFATRHEILKKELERNPVKTVLIEVSHDALQRNIQIEGPDANTFQIARFETLNEKLSFCKKAFLPNDYAKVCSDLLFIGIKSWSKLLVLGKDPQNQMTMKGYFPEDAVDVSISGEAFKDIHNTLTISNQNVNGNLEQLTHTIEMCQKYGAEVILFVTPLAESFIAKYKNMDEAYAQYWELGRKYDIPVYDFNLLKNKADLLSDKDAFSNETHLSNIGAAVMTEQLCTILKKAETEDVSQYFYPSYEAMKADSPYMAYLQ